MLAKQPPGSLLEPLLSLWPEMLEKRLEIYFTSKRTMKHQKRPNRKVSKPLHTFDTFMKHYKPSKLKVSKPLHTFVIFKQGQSHA